MYGKVGEMSSAVPSVSLFRGGLATSRPPQFFRCQSSFPSGTRRSIDANPFPFRSTDLD